MDLLNIFRAGTHTSASGIKHTITEADLQGAIDGYSVELHEAPIVVGHPQDNNPAYGWVKGMQLDDKGNLEAEPAQVDDDFAEMVNNGRFKKISASFYLPDSPANPTPGSYYLRHVGFLGAQPPAVKGLRDAAFNEADDDYIEFEEPWNQATAARLWRGLRDFLLGQYSLDDVDRALPAYAIEDLEAGARKAIEDDTNIINPAFNEDDSMDKAELKEAQDKLAADQAAFAEKQAAMDAQVADFAEREVADRKKGHEDYIDSQIKTGKVKPADKDGMVSFMESLDDSTAEFGESKASALDFYKAEVEARTPAIDFEERSKDDGHRATEMDAEELAQKAVAFQETDHGKHLSTSQAIAAVIDGKDKA